MSKRELLCTFCRGPLTVNVPDGWTQEIEAAHQDCLPTPGAGGAQRIADERRRQIHVEGFTAETDQTYEHGELARAALAYVSAAVNFGEGMRQWPNTWNSAYWKPSLDPVRNLEKAGALIAAEIDRLIAASRQTDFEWPGLETPGGEQ